MCGTSAHAWPFESSARKSRKCMRTSGRTLDEHRIASVQRAPLQSPESSHAPSMREAKRSGHQFFIAGLDVRQSRTSREAKRSGHPILIGRGLDVRRKRRAKPETYPREKRDDSVSRVAADDGDVHLANIKALLLGNEGVGAHNVESGDTCAWAQCIS